MPATVASWMTFRLWTEYSVSDEVVLDLGAHQVGLLPSLRSLGFELGEAAGRVVGLHPDRLALLLALGGIGLGGQPLDPTVELLHLVIALGNRSRIDAPVLVVGREQEIENFALERVALTPGRVHDRGRAPLLDEVRDVVVGALELGEVDQPALLDRLAMADPLLLVALKA